MKDISFDELFRFCGWLSDISKLKIPIPKNRKELLEIMKEDWGTVEKALESFRENELNRKIRKS